MAIVPAKCTSCGGTLKVKSEDKTAICPFCGTEYLVQEAIEQYNITNVYNIEQASLTFDHRKLFYDKIAAAEKQLRTLKDYPKALASFVALENDVPDEFRIWSGKLEAQTKEYNAVAVSNIHMHDDQYINSLIKDYEYAYKTGDSEQKSEINEKFLGVLKESAEKIGLTGKVLEENDTERKKYRTRSNALGTVGAVFNVLAVILGILALLVTGFLLLVLISANFEPWEAVEQALVIIGISFIPSVVLFIPGIILSKNEKKVKKKDVEISNNTLHRIKDELNIVIPEFAPARDYKNYIVLCQKKESHLLSIVEKYTLSK